ncbi:hypothetical protein VAEU17_230030 [Vibrio aestuarianus]|nr:hypothetical protein VAEU17_230030 [Vibrio aestuarianus]
MEFAIILHPIRTKISLVQKNNPLVFPKILLKVSIFIFV